MVEPILRIRAAMEQNYAVANLLANGCDDYIDRLRYASDFSCDSQIVHKTAGGCGRRPFYYLLIKVDHGFVLGAGRTIRRMGMLSYSMVKLHLKSERKRGGFALKKRVAEYYVLYFFLGAHMNYLLDERLALLRDMESDISVYENFGLFNALICCLSSEEAISLLSQEAERSSRLRNGLLRKVVQDLGASPSLEHSELAEHLITRLEQTDARGRQGIGYCLSKLLPCLPMEIQRSAQLAFLRSRFVGLRRRGYKAVAADPMPEISFLMEALTEFKDAECAWLLVKILSPQDLVVVKDEILPHLSEGWQISRLYLRMSEVDPSVVDELDEIDGVSYSYVLAKLGRSISVEQAKNLFARYETDERLGLLVWSFGQMRLWDALMWLKGRLA